MQEDSHFLNLDTLILIPTRDLSPEHYNHFNLSTSRYRGEQKLQGDRNVTQSI
jgi:hypothetical protein